MHLGNELATGFVTDEVQVTADEKVGLPPDGSDARAPEAPRLPAAEPKLTAAG